MYYYLELLFERLDVSLDTVCLRNYMTDSHIFPPYCYTYYTIISSFFTDKNNIFFFLFIRSWG